MSSQRAVAVFWLSTLLVGVNVAYILLVLPETAPAALEAEERGQSSHGGIKGNPTGSGCWSGAGLRDFLVSGGSGDGGGMRQRFRRGMEYLPSSYSLLDTFRIFQSDPFMKNLALIVFVYYTALWAIVSTLMVFVTQHLHFDKVTLGWLFSSYVFSSVPLYFLSFLVVVVAYLCLYLSVSLLFS